MIRQLIIRNQPLSSGFSLIIRPYLQACNQIQSNYSEETLTFSRFYFVFRPKRKTSTTFSRILRSFSGVSPLAKNFSIVGANFCKFSWHRRDSIGPKIVQIGVVLAIFRPFEITRMLSCFSSRLIFQGRYKTEMAIFQRLFVYMVKLLR